MTVFEIVVYQLDTIIGMMYLSADNSSIDCRGTLAILSYTQLHDLLRCILKNVNNTLYRYYVTTDNYIFEPTLKQKHSN